MRSYIYPNTPNAFGRVPHVFHNADWMHPETLLQMAIDRKELTEAGSYIVMVDPQTPNGSPSIFFMTVAVEKIERLKIIR